MSTLMSPLDPGEAVFSIGDLAERTGVSAGTLRIWETRHGFPVPTRLASGHRRYGDVDVAAVQQVVQLRDSGVRLDAAIARVLHEASARQAAASSAEVRGSDSVFARLRREHPALLPTRLSKRTLLAMSWAIEDEFYAQARRAHLFGAFQKVQHYRSARNRWVDLGRQSSSTFVFADFEQLGGDPVIQVPLAPDAPMSREWSVVCDSPDLAVALTAWELPGQGAVADSERVFESLWTADPAPVRDAARVCAGLAVAAGSERATEVAADLAGPVSSSTDVAALTSLFNRSVAYVDRAHAG